MQSLSPVVMILNPCYDYTNFFPNPSYDLTNPLPTKKKKKKKKKKNDVTVGSGPLYLHGGTQ